MLVKFQVGKNTGMRPPGIGWRTKICPVWEKLNHGMVNKQRRPRGNQLTCHVEIERDKHTVFQKQEAVSIKKESVSHFVPSVIKSLAGAVIRLQLYSRDASAFVLSLSFPLPGKTLSFHWGSGGERSAWYYLSFFKEYLLYFSFTTDHSQLLPIWKKLWLYLLFHLLCGKMSINQNPWVLIFKDFSCKPFKTWARVSGKVTLVAESDFYPASSPPELYG